MFSCSVRAEAREQQLFQKTRPGGSRVLGDRGHIVPMTRFLRAASTTSLVTIVPQRQVTALPQGLDQVPVDDLRGVGVFPAPLDQRGQVGHAPPRGGPGGEGAQGGAVAVPGAGGRVPPRRGEYRCRRLGRQVGQQSAVSQFGAQAGQRLTTTCGRPPVTAKTLSEAGDILDVSEAFNATTHTITTTETWTRNCLPAIPVRENKQEQAKSKAAKGGRMSVAFKRSTYHHQHKCHRRITRTARPRSSRSWCAALAPRKGLNSTPSFRGS
ncbi:hypothetical protein EDD27_0165 [Nonomuraea polychroma]|uniref:Uncharacterized protein n=1 Tax=Nonomuraea polychroma TaxID=46176 RepID=A0A438LWW3_9ACTN|nr:hypothetical protein EDD27_0165 [Nonomuraea polychroma]